MADRILSVETLTLLQSTDLTSTSASQAISIPTPQEVYSKIASPGGFPAYDPRDAVTYIFDGGNLQDVELVHQGSTEGVKVLAATEKTIGPWRIVASPPNYIHLPTSGSVTIRVTTILGR